MMKNEKKYITNFQVLPPTTLPLSQRHGNGKGNGMVMEKEQSPTIKCYQGTGKSASYSVFFLIARFTQYINPGGTKETCFLLYSEVLL